MINKTQISTKLEEIPIEMLAAQTNFSIHADNEITASSFVMGFFLMISKSHNTLSDWALEVSKLLKRVFSQSAISFKLQYRQLDFVKALLKHTLQNQIYQGGINNLGSSLLKFFPRVFLEDSMCVKLPANLAGIFPGAHSKTGQAATGRIQCRIELKSGTTSHLEIQSFRDNDQKFASHILHILRAGDLVIRDLGYCVLWVFRLIGFLGGFFLSRYRFNTNIYDPDTGEQIDLIKKLRKANKNKQNTFELDILIGKKEQLPVRLIAIKVPQNIAQHRRRKASKNRNKKANHSKEYMEFLGWTIFITNVAPEVWTPQEMLQVYGFRWRIEIVFKAWKSQFKFEKLFKHKQKLSPPRAEITLCLLLIWITLFFVRLFNFFLSQVYQGKQKFVSILKFAKFFKDHFGQLISCPDWDFYIELVAKYCVYDKRKKIPNFCENLYLIKTYVKCKL